MGILYGQWSCAGVLIGNRMEISMVNDVLSYHTWFHENCIHQSSTVKCNHNISIIKHLNLCWIILHQFSVIVSVYTYNMFRKHYFLIKINNTGLVSKFMVKLVRLCHDYENRTPVHKDISVSNLCV